MLLNFSEPRDAMFRPPHVRLLPSHFTRSRRGRFLRGASHVELNVHRSQPNYSTPSYSLPIHPSAGRADMQVRVLVLVLCPFWLLPA